MFPQNKTASISFELVNDTKTPKARLFRYRSEGSEDPYFKISVTSIPLEYSEGMAWGMEISSKRGPLKVFDYPNPFPAIRTLNSVVLYQDASKGDESIKVITSQSNQPGVVAGGDFVQIQGSAKAYGIRPFGYTSDGDGVVTLLLTQGLVKDYPAGSSIAYGADVVFSVCIEKSDDVSVKSSDAKHIVHDVELIEQI